MQAVFPRFSSSTYKFMGMAILIPTAFLPLSVISYTSLLSIIATLFIVVVLAVDGFSKYDTPGSLLEFAQTSPWPVSSQKLGLSFGLFMAGVRYWIS
jgi:solute carrier family 32 (vesicular inhibitory amino acid transporter)